MAQSIQIFFVTQNDDYAKDPMNTEFTDTIIEAITNFDPEIDADDILIDISEKASDSPVVEL